MRTAHRNAPNTTLFASFPASQDPPCTVGAPSTTDDILRAHFFLGWMISRSSEISFDGLGSVATLDRSEVLWASPDVTGGTFNGRDPKVSSVKLTEEQYQMAATIETQSLTVLRSEEALYVHLMFRYLSGTADNLAVPPSQLIFDLPEMHRG